MTGIVVEEPRRKRKEKQAKHCPSLATISIIKFDAHESHGKETRLTVYITKEIQVQDHENRR
jgi:hypothetical protein